MSALLTLNEAARELTLSRRTVERLVATGKLRTVRPSPGTVRVEQREIDAYLASLKGRRVA